MLTPDYLEHISDEAVNLYAELENTIIRDIIRRLVNTKGIMTESARWQIKRLQQAGLVYEDVIKRIAEHSGSSEKLIQRLFEESTIEALKYDDNIYISAGLNPIPIKQSPAMLKMLTTAVKSTNGTLKNLTLTTANSAQNSFLNALDIAYMQVLSGAFDYNTAIFNTVKTLVDNGIDIIYPSGRKDKIDVVVRRNIVTSVGQTTGKLQEARADEMNCDLVETTAHAGARPSHAAWQGKVFSRSGINKKYPDFRKSTGYGTPGGLKGINCRHDFFPYFEEISKRAYTDKDLNEINNKKVNYNDKEYTEYEATQLQRLAERNIRALKRELAGYDGIIQSNADSSLKQQTKSKFNVSSLKLKKQESELNEFIKQTGLTRDRSRERIIEFNNKISTKAILSNKNQIKNYTKLHIESTFNTNNLQNNSSYDIINSAYRFSKKEDADQILRPHTEELWPKLSLVEKQSTYKYTESSGKFNRPLRGYDKEWDNYIGIGKVPLNNEGAEEWIEGLTAAIEKSEIKQDIWLFRGSNKQSLAGLLGIDKEKIIPSKIENINKKFKGQTIKDTAFLSTGISADAGFHDIINYEILAPKGTKGIYAEPFSAFGGTNTSGTWDGKEKASYIGSEAEIILQKDTEFEIIEIKKVADKFTVIMKIT